MRCLIILIGLLSSTALFAQQKYIYLSLDVSKPLSNTRWISDVTFAAGKLGYRGFITPNFSAGVDIGWASFDQYEPTSTKETGTGAITTDYFHYIYQYSGAISGQYYLKPEGEERFFPYAGLGLGASTNEYVLYYNIYEDRERSWGFLTRPEVGLLWRFSERSSLGIMAAIHYDYTTSKSEKFSYNSFSSIGFQIGLMSMSF